MAESKYGPYICTDLKHIEKMPDYKGDQKIGRGYDEDGYRLSLEHINWMDGEVIPEPFTPKVPGCGLQHSKTRDPNPC